MSVYWAQHSKLIKVNMDFIANNNEISDSSSLDLDNLRGLEIYLPALLLKRKMLIINSALTFLVVFFQLLFVLVANNIDGLRYNHFMY